MIEYNGTLGTMGTLALAIILLPIFVGCTTNSMNLVESDTQTILTKQTNPKANPEATQQAVKNILDSTVHLVLKDANGKFLEGGSGFFVRPDLVVTNLYVVERAASGYAKLVGKGTAHPIEEIIRNEEHGLALLKVPAPGVKPLSLGNSDAVQYGSPVYVVKNLPELNNELLKGITTYRSIDNRTISIGSGGIYASGDKIIRGPYFYSGNIEWFGLTTQISRESSGGPVLNNQGKVIGISAHRGGISGKTGNFAISSKTLEALLRLEKLLDIVK